MARAHPGTAKRLDQPCSRASATRRIRKHLFLTGSQLYQQLNRNLDTISVAAISDAPAALTVGSPGALTVASAAGPPITLTIVPTTEAGAADVPVIYAVEPLSAGRIFVGGKATVLSVLAAAAASPYDIAAAYAAKYGALAAGQNINVGVAFINNTTGAASLRSTGQVFAG